MWINSGQYAIFYVFCQLLEIIKNVAVSAYLNATGIFRCKRVFLIVLRLTFGLKHLARPRLTAEFSCFTGALSTCPSSRSAVTWTTSPTCDSLTLAANADCYNVGTQRTCSCTTKRFTCYCSGSCTAHGITATLKHNRCAMTFRNDHKNYEIKKFYN